MFVIQQLNGQALYLRLPDNNWPQYTAELHLAHKFPSEGEADSWKYPGEVVVDLHQFGCGGSD